MFSSFFFNSMRPFKVRARKKQQYERNFCKKWVKWKWGASGRKNLIGESTGKLANGKKNFKWKKRERDWNFIRKLDFFHAANSCCCSNFLFLSQSAFYSEIKRFKFFPHSFATQFLNTKSLSRSLTINKIWQLYDEFIECVYVENFFITLLVDRKI